MTTALPDLSLHWAGLAALAVFAVAYLLVVTEEMTHLRKSKPVVVAAGILWGLAAAVLGRAGLGHEVEAAFRHVFLEYAELLLFLLVAMTYVSALEERGVFDALRARLVGSGVGYRPLFWLTGAMAFMLSPVADNLTTALVMCAVVMAVGRDAPRFVVLSCINIVVAANAGGAFSPFGDITTLMVWQKGVVPFGGFFALFLPAVATFVVPAAVMSFAVPAGRPEPRHAAPRLRRGARRNALLFALTLAAAVLVRNLLGLPPVLGMMTGLGLLQLFAYTLGRSARAGDDYPFDVFGHMAAVEWDTLLFFYGVMACVGALGVFGTLALASHLLYGQLGATAANVAIGAVSAILDNIPLMYAVLTMHPDMSQGQWLLITLTTGVGGSLLSIGSAAGIALMGQARGTYTFRSHLRWSPAVALGYAAGIAVHLTLNAGAF